MHKKILIKLFGEEWVNALGQEFLDSKEFINIANKIGNLRETLTIYPSRGNVFKAFRLTPLSKVKVVLLAMDPYHDGSADGLSFSNSLTKKISPSLRNILKEIDTEYPENKELISHGRLDPQDLSRLALQGVLMLNTALTVEEHVAGSHLELWKPFTEEVIKTLNNEGEIIWLLLGKEAQKYSKLITNPSHSIVTASHPAAEIYGNGGFFNSNCFKKVNLELFARNKQEIIW